MVTCKNSSVTTSPSRAYGILSIYWNLVENMYVVVGIWNAGACLRMVTAALLSGSL